MADDDETTTVTAPPPPEAPPRRLERARSGRMVAGVCEGLGRYFDVDPVIFRVGFAVAVFAGGAGLLAYGIAWLVVPEEGHRRPLVSLGLRGWRGASWLPYVLIGIGVLSLTDGFDGDDDGVGFGLVLVAFGAFLLWNHDRRPHRPRPNVSRLPEETVGLAGQEAEEVEETPPPSEPPPPRSVLGRVAVSLLLVGAGLGLLAGADAQELLAGGLLLVGGALVVGAWWGRSHGLIALGIVLAAGAAGAAVVDVPLRGGIGERRWDPVGAVASTYRFGVGEAILDLTATTAEDIDTKVTLGVGSLQVIVPADADVVVDASAAVGEVRVLGRDADGVDAERHVVDRGGELGQDIRLDLRVGLGEVEVRRAAA